MYFLCPSVKLYALVCKKYVFYTLVCKIKRFYALHVMRAVCIFYKLRIFARKYEQMPTSAVCKKLPSVKFAQSVKKYTRLYFRV